MSEEVLHIGDRGRGLLSSKQTDIKEGDESCVHPWGGDGSWKRQPWSWSGGQGGSASPGDLVLEDGLQGWQTPTAIDPKGSPDQRVPSVKCFNGEHLHLEFEGSVEEKKTLEALAARRTPKSLLEVSTKVNTALEPGGSRE